MANIFIVTYQGLLQAANGEICESCKKMIAYNQEIVIYRKSAERRVRIAHKKCLSEREGWLEANHN